MNVRYPLAKKVAIAAGELALEYLAQHKATGLNIESKGVQDFVTIADQQVERQIRQQLQEACPEDGFYGEESDTDLEQMRVSDQGFWVVDPIDGTSNFMRDVDQWGVSIAYVCDGDIQIGVVYDPVRKLLYHSAKGQGAFCNEQRQQLNKSTPLDPTLILGHSRRADVNVYLNALRYLYEQGVEHRKFGSAALGLAQVITGQCDGYFEADLNPWDCMAGLLLISEAGGAVVSGGDMPKTLCNGPVAAGVVSQQAILEKLVAFSR